MSKHTTAAVGTAFDPGYGTEPFKSLCERMPGMDVYPGTAFRVEWGPIFHRGRLDGSAKVVVLGQDPAVQETITRRILVGVAGKRVQGFLAKLGITRSYVLLNTFLYSVLNQAAGDHYKHNAAVAAYRNEWLDAVFKNGSVKAVVAFGGLADTAWKSYTTTTSGAAVKKFVAYAHVLHPTYPTSAAGGSATKQAELTKEMLAQWNGAIPALRDALSTPDEAVAFEPYGDDFADTELPDIPSADLPPGIPAWMANEDGWGARTGSNTAEKRATITVTVPKAYLP